MRSPAGKALEKKIRKNRFRKKEVSNYLHYLEVRSLRKKIAIIVNKWSKAKAGSRKLPKKTEIVKNKIGKAESQKLLKTQFTDGARGFFVYKRV